MKRLLLLIGLSLLIILIGNNIGISKIAQPPVGKTGAPGEGSCMDCHGSMTGSGSGISVDFNNPGSMFFNDSSYTISFSVDDIAQSKYGFELTAITAVGAQAGTINLLNTNNTSLQQGSSREYIGHSNASSNNTWSFVWKAPSASSGITEVYFYSNAIAANDNGNTSGDHLYTWMSMKNITNPVDVREHSLLSHVNLFYDGNEILMQANGLKTMNTKVSLYSIGGQLIYQELIEVQHGYYEYSIKTPAVNSGLYLVRIHSDEFSSIHKMVL